MISNPKISFIMPVYNCEKTVNKAIDSIINQSYKNIELVIINDGSTDNTLKKIKKYSNNKNIIVIDQLNSGPAYSRNVGIKKSTGDYIAFCDGDDYLDKNISQNFIDFEKKSNFTYDVVLFKTNRVINGTIVDKTEIHESFEILDDGRQELIDSIYNKFLKYNKIFGFDGVCGKFISSKLIKSNKIVFPENMYRFEDAYFCRKTFLESKKIYYMNQVGYYYISNDDSLCNKYDSNAPKIFLDALIKLGEDNYNNNNFYIKTITTLTECEKMYFLNSLNKNSIFKTRKEFKKMISNDIYHNAIKKVNFKTIPAHYKVEIILLRMHFYFSYFLLKKTHLNRKKHL